MGRKRYSAEQIIRHLRQAEIHSSQGRSVAEICREIGVTPILTIDSAKSMEKWE